MKYRLLAPGPTPVPDRVLKEMSKTIIHHRTAQFEKIFFECRENLKWLLNSKYAPLILSCSGTGAFEASIENFFSTGDTVLCVTGGKFGENWFNMSKAFGLNAIAIEVAWGEALDVNKVEQALKAYPQARGVILVASETSTGVRHPYEAVAQLVKEKSDCLLVIDAVTALGVWDIAPEQQHIDLLVGGGQKGLMLPPGLGFVWASEKAWARQSQSNLPKFYFNLVKEKKAQESNQTAYTPAVSLIMGLYEALLIMKEEGREKIFQRHARLAHATRVAMTALGLKLFAKAPSESITSVISPEILPDNAIYKALMNHANLTIAGGQGQLKGKIFRIGHMGYVDEIDLIGIFGTLEIILKKLGYDAFTPGASFAAAMPILQSGF
ncbi:MAG: alanine--glyoxylate aminotransferase family protein [Myxococcales bacterium]|nr:alanine--glyoxylate aminotransferase family protein [Myxococcales bacterium]USN51492.1 MAG: alanine--glyoxylate aminotransferase family protein [Myxococcales bacterium]